MKIFKILISTLLILVCIHSNISCKNFTYTILKYQERAKAVLSKSLSSGDNFHFGADSLANKSSDSNAVSTKHKRKQTVYKAKIYYSQYSFTGTLYSVTDSTIVLKQKYKGKEVISSILYSSIKKIKMIKKGSGGAGFAIGATTSLLTGVLIAASVDDGPYANPGLERMGAIGAGVLFAIPLGAIGAGIGKNTGKTFEVGYDKNQFLKVSDELYNYSEEKYLLENK